MSFWPFFETLNLTQPRAIRDAACSQDCRSRSCIDFDEWQTSQTTRDLQCWRPDSLSVCLSDPGMDEVEQSQRTCNGTINSVEYPDVGAGWTPGTGGAIILKQSILKRLWFHSLTAITAAVIAELYTL